MLPSFCFQIGSNSGEGGGEEMNGSCCLLIIFSYLAGTSKTCRSRTSPGVQGNESWQMYIKENIHTLSPVSLGHPPSSPKRCYLVSFCSLCSRLSSGLCQCYPVLYSPLGTHFLVSRGNHGPEDLVYSFLWCSDSWLTSSAAAALASLALCGMALLPSIWSHFKTFLKLGKHHSFWCSGGLGGPPPLLT